MNKVSTKLVILACVISQAAMAQNNDLTPVSGSPQNIGATPDVTQDDDTSLKANEQWDSFGSRGQNTRENQVVTIEDILDSNIEYRYAAFDVPDPFVPPVVTSTQTEKSFDVANILQKYDVTALNVYGIWETIPGVRKAFILSNRGEGVTIQVGDPIGKNGGEVVAIETNHIRVREFKLAQDGTRQFRDIVRWLGGSKEIALGKEGLTLSNNAGQDGINGISTGQPVPNSNIGVQPIGSNGFESSDQNYNGQGGFEPSPVGIPSSVPGSVPVGNVPVQPTGGVPQSLPPVPAAPASPPSAGQPPDIPNSGIQTLEL